MPLAPILERIRIKSESNKWLHGRTFHIKHSHRMVSSRPVGCNLVDSPFHKQTIIIIFICLPVRKHIPVGSRLSMGLVVPCWLSHGRITVYPPGPVKLLSRLTHARTAESRTSVQDIIDTPSVSKASGTKRGAVSLAPSGWSMHKTRALRHSLRWRTLKRTDLHCPDFTATAPPPYVKNCHYSHLSEFCTRQQY